MNEDALPGGWVWTRLGEVIDKVPLTDRKLKQSEYQEKGKIPVIDQGQNFIGGYSDREEFKVSCETPVIIFGDHTKAIKYVNFDFIAGADGVKVIRPHQIFYPKLFYYFIQQIQLPDKGYARHFQFLEKSDIPIPPLSEQLRIVTKLEELFTKLDAGVEALKKTQAQLKRYRQSVLKATCEGKLVPNEAELAKNERRAYEHAEVLLASILKERRENLGAKYKEAGGPDTSGFPELPEGWCWASIEHIGELISGQHILEKDYNYESVGLPYLTGPADFGLVHPIVSRWTEKPKTIANKNDVLITVKGAGVGKVNILDLDKAAISRQLMAIRAKNIENQYIFFFILSKFNFFQKLGAGSTVPGIDRDGILNTFVPLPPSLSSAASSQRSSAASLWLTGLRKPWSRA